MKATAAPILRRFGFRRVIIVNAVISSVFLAFAALFTSATPHLVIIAVLLIGGFFRSLQFTSVNALAYADVDQRRMSRATSFVSVAQQLAISMGVAVAALGLEATRFWRDDANILASDFAPVFLLVAAISMVSIFFFIKLPTDAGAVLTGPKVPKAKQITESAREPEPQA
jgi:MFS family permease